MHGTGADQGKTRQVAELSAAVAGVLARVDAHAGRARARREEGAAGGGADERGADGKGDRGKDDRGKGTGARTPGRQHEAQDEAQDGQQPPVPAPLAKLQSAFGLSAFERDIVLLCAAAELDPTTAARCAAACGDPERAHPTFSLALAAFEDAHWSALTPVAPLRRWRLVELGDETRLTTSRLRLDERILHFLTGSAYLDPRLHGMLRPASATDELPTPHEEAADRVAAGWSVRRPDAPFRVELIGGDLRTREDIAATAAARAGLGLYAMSAEDVPTEPAARDAFARLWQREAVLLPAALLLETGELDREHAAATEAFIASAAVPIAVAGAEPRRTDRPRGERVAVPQLDDAEQQRLWRDAFDGVPGLDAGQLHSLAAQFQLPPHTVRSAAVSVRRDLPDASAGTGAAHGLAWQAGLSEARIGLEGLGRRIEPEAGWDDLVLAERQLKILREIVAHVRQRARVHQEWGFARTLRRGLGVTALFAGSSGTGKTLAAEVMAKELGLDLFIIDLSQVVSKYIGETEKNLRKVFDAAELGGALLLFDEADALFGKRSEVKDSHDRYANLEVSYLLMRMEAYRGLAVLTTNMKKALDTAFMRRIRFVADFPFPGHEERAEIWRRVLPSQAPMKDIEPDALAQLTVAGGSIRNIALSGAFLAAEEGDALQMRHMLAAARTEYQKLERSLTPSEVRGWV
ncbi:ATP-binding protein [Streptomyces sp. WMMB 322]|uniref:ATP-binding protein n=1 Tax=Streptomyces sp. WMMB 322 TaxID=1286821 RepID=UPI0006E454F7|nr:ATP-binding protein [Streptomyces sp. WMMB 322]SCK08527.1 ATPase family associated with various cellular activities (AAA) [Streptomyces sp. WMMB 322]